MLSMVGGALKKINGVKDVNKLSSQCHTKQKDSIPEYQPTPIHVLKAKSAAGGYEYDPVSNYTASSSRVTLPSSTKRSHSSDAVVPAKRRKLVVECNETEAKFSDSDDEENNDKASSSHTATVTDVSTSAKSGDVVLSQSFPKDKPAVNLPRFDDNTSLKSPSTNLSVSAATMKSASTQSKPKDSSVNSRSSSASQTNSAVSLKHSDSVKLLSAVPTETDLSRQQSGSCRTSACKDDTKNTNKVLSSSSASSSKFRHKNGDKTDNKNSDSTLKPKHHHNTADNQHSSVVSGRRLSSTEGHKHDRSSNRTKSDQGNPVKTGKNNCTRGEVASETSKISDGKHHDHTHHKSEQIDKKVTLSGSVSHLQKEKHSSESSSQKHKSNTTSSESSSSHKHKTSHDTDSTHKQPVNKATSHHSDRGDGSHTKSCRSETDAKSGSAKSGKVNKPSSHKRRESVDVAGNQHTQVVAGTHTSTAAAGNSSVVADMKRVNAARSIELFGEDSDTESDLLKSSSVKQKQHGSGKTSVPRHSSSCSDDVLLLPTDDLSDADDTFEQCHQLYNELVRHQETQPATCTSSSVSRIINRILL